MNFAPVAMGNPAAPRAGTGSFGDPHRTFQRAADAASLNLNARIAATYAHIQYGVALRLEPLHAAVGCFHAAQYMIV